jgi:hypothetical protein
MHVLNGLPGPNLQVLLSRVLHHCMSACGHWSGWVCCSGACTVRTESVCIAGPRMANGISPEPAPACSSSTQLGVLRAACWYSARPALAAPYCHLQLYLSHSCNLTNTTGRLWRFACQFPTPRDGLLGQYVRSTCEACNHNCSPQNDWIPKCVDLEVSCLLERGAGARTSLLATEPALHGRAKRERPFLNCQRDRGSRYSPFLCGLRLRLHVSGPRSYALLQVLAGAHSRRTWTRKYSLPLRAKVA